MVSLSQSIPRVSAIKINFISNCENILFEIIKRIQFMSRIVYQFWSKIHLIQFVFYYQLYI